MSDPRMIGDPLRSKPYLWITWITKLLAGEDRCALKAWLKSHFEVAKLKEDPGKEANLAKWTEKHDAMVNALAEGYRKRGDLVRVEDENAFKIDGKTITVAGKPDIVTLPQADHAIIVDAKSGKRRQSDHWQVLIYIWALPRTWLTAKKVTGAVAYQGDTYPDIVAVKTFDDWQGRIVREIQTAASDIPPRAVPSKRECEFCDIAKCPKRFDEKRITGQTDLF